ncbi:sentrin-specific protease 1-like [Olea europaea subsp. europaea]|uniref:Sentrin-specific protease 1-like n=1 Tax=Olea europaea subsp. europaea TaxID=158383 RepID=A0A8S0VMX9_OLEEU|nr:sentrin-specific protease 1-like [Olea europaea subsp. europaea]
MEKSKAAKLVINVEDMSECRSKRKSVVSPKKTPPNKQPASLTAKKLHSKKIKICDLVPTEAEMAMPYIDDMQHNKTIQPEFFRGSRRKESRKEKSVDHSHINPPRRCEVISHQETPRADEGPLGPQHSPNEEQYHGIQGSADEHKFLSESVTAMISSSMDEILRRFNDRKGCPVNEYEDTEAAVEGFEKIDEVKKLQPVVDKKGKGKVDPTEDVAFPCSLEPPSFDLEGSPTPEPASELPVKRASRPARILRSPFVAGEGKVPRHENNVIVFGNYKDHVEEADKSAFLAGKTYRDWKVLEGIEPYVKVLSALMKALGILKKDPDYNESECKQMKVTIDSTLPQQTNGHDCRVFVILYALYILRDGKCTILHQFDAAKCRLNIASLLYKHREPYVKKARQAFEGEGCNRMTNMKTFVNEFYASVVSLLYFFQAVEVFILNTVMWM